MSVKIQFLHPHDNYMGNIIWATPIIESEFNDLENSLIKIRKLGYFASAFPEGDGITFSHENYDKDKAIIDFQECFPWMEFTFRKIEEPIDYEPIIEEVIHSKKDEGLYNLIDDFYGELIKGKKLAVLPISRLIIHNKLDLYPFIIYPECSVNIKSLRPVPNKTLVVG